MLYRPSRSRGAPGGRRASIWVSPGFSVGRGGGPSQAPLAPMSCISWNCRGLGKKECVNVLKSLVLNYKPNVLFLMETKGSKERIQKIGNLIGFSHGEIVDSQGLAGGIALMWNDEILLNCKAKTARIICGEVFNLEGTAVWSFLACHGTPYGVEKAEFWEGMEEITAMQTLPWLIFGDLNEVTSSQEKWGGRSIYKRRLHLKEFMMETGAIDLGYIGHKYTWCNGHEGRSLIMERLDRAVGNKD